MTGGSKKRKCSSTLCRFNGSLKFDDFKTIQSVFFKVEANMIGIAAGLTIGGKSLYRNFC
jgi:hypothetical protein